MCPYTLRTANNEVTDRRNMCGEACGGNPRFHHCLFVKKALVVRLNLQWLPLMLRVKRAAKLQAAADCVLLFPHVLSHFAFCEWSVGGRFVRFTTRNTDNYGTECT